MYKLYIISCQLQSFHVCPESSFWSIQRSYKILQVQLVNSQILLFLLALVM